ncbi:hypothetical protein TNCV_2377861 [Trichonephila clavipes]|nr:hypothetical protein TNCV_2377861 [Trichonephila clavipes]
MLPLDVAKTVFLLDYQSSGTPKRGTTSRLTGAGSLLPPVYSDAWAKDHDLIGAESRTRRSPHKGSAGPCRKTPLSIMK